MWEELAGAYAEHVDPVTSASVEPALRLAELRPGDRVLDVACGAGTLSLAACADGATVAAVDVAEPFASMVRDRATQRGLEGVQAHLMDGQALGFEDATFDAAFSLFGVFLFPDRARGFREMHRVLRPGGRAVVTGFHGPPANEWIALLGAAVERAFPEMEPPDPPDALEVADPERLAAELEASGFSDVEVEVVEQTHEWPDAEAAWRSVAEAAPIFQAIADEVGPSGVEAIRGRFRELVAKRSEGNGPVRLVMPVNFALARKA